MVRLDEASNTNPRKYVHLPFDIDNTLIDFNAGE